MNDEYDDENEDAQESQALIPLEQDTLTFNGKPLIVVRLPEGRAGVVLRWICENLNVFPEGQIRRIRQTSSNDHSDLYTAFSVPRYQEIPEEAKG